MSPQQRPGVYFEAGYALGLGIPVFWCVRSDDLANVHFDTRQYNHIVWENERQLAEQLYLYVSAIVGKGTAIQQGAPAGRLLRRWAWSLCEKRRKKTCSQA